MQESEKVCQRPHQRHRIQKMDTRSIGLLTAAVKKVDNKVLDINIENEKWPTGSRKHLMSFRQEGHGTTSANPARR